MNEIKLSSLLLLLLLISFSCLTALEYSPNQILFKTTGDLQIQRGRTGLTEFDAFLDRVQATSVTPVTHKSNNRWFSAKINVQPDWSLVKNNTLRFEGIDIIQPNYLNSFHVTPNDQWYSLQQMSIMEMPQAWNYSTGSTTIIVAVVDSGILKEHPDLHDNLYYNQTELDGLPNVDDDNNGYIDDYCGWDFADAPEMNDVALGDFEEQDNDVNDENFHGTHVAGILGAVTNNKIGISGACWNVRIMPLRAGFRTTSGTGFLQDDDAAAAVIYGADMGASVMNLSWGDATYSPIIADACNYAYEKGVTLVASAGNDPGPYLSYPAKLASVISVGAVDQYKNLAGFSSYGAELDLVAPGQQIYSTYKAEGVDMYKEQSGTSMSAPFVTGSIALLKSIQPNLTPDEVRARLLTSTDDLGSDGFDQFYGHGLLNARKLLENLSSPVLHVTYPPDHIGIASEFDFLGTVESNDFFRYSVMRALDKGEEGLVWKDVMDDTFMPHYYYEPVTNGVIAHFNIQDYLVEGDYVIRFQYEKRNGDIYNLFKTLSIDQSPPQMDTLSFQLFSRYDGQNIRYYAAALFDEPVRAELVIYSDNQQPISCYPSKLDSVQVWLLPNTIPQGNIDLEIIATNNSNQVYHSSLISDAVNISYDVISSYGFESRVIGNAMVPLNRVQDFDMNGIPEIMAMDLPSSGYGVDRFYEPTNDLYSVKYSFNNNNRFWPLDIGNTNSRGEELLTLNLDSARLYETRVNYTYPDSSIWTETGISGGVIADYNADGTKDILLVKNTTTERVVNLYRRTSGTDVFANKITLYNTSQTSLRNMFVPTVICQKLDNDNIPDILTADTDGDVMIYEPTGTTSAALTWSVKLPIANTYYLTSGDYDGDGIIDFFVGGYNKDVQDPNQTYWYFEGFRSTGNNAYTSMGHIQFNQVMTQNAIQSYDLDGDNKQEIILSIAPNMYVVKYINGQFKPIYYGKSMRTYQIAAWTHDKQPYFITNQNDSSDTLRAVVWSKQQAFSGPPTPSNFLVTPINGHKVTLRWQYNGADLYRVYRKDSTSSSQLLAEVIGSAFSDTTVTVGTRYEYSVTAYFAEASPSESIPTGWVEAIPMPQPRLTEITMIGVNELRMIFDQILATSALNPGCYKVDHNIGNPLSVNSVANQHGVQLRFRDAIQDIVGSYLIKLQNVYGVTGVEPIQDLFSFSYNPDYTPPFIQHAAVRADNRSVEIHLSEDIFTSSIQPDNFTLQKPDNDALNSIQSVSAEDNVIIVTLVNKLKYSNRPYYLTVYNISDLAGNVISPNQNSCTFALNNFTDLRQIVVYPNPIKASEHQDVNFLNFPTGKKGKLSIFTSSGDLVYQTRIGPFNLNNNNITCHWGLTNQKGTQVSSGIYFYLIEMGSETKKGKIAVLN